MHWTTRIGITGVALCVLVVMTINVVGWLHTLPGFPGQAAAFVAVSLEFVAFVAWEHICKYRASGDLGRLLLACVGLTLAAAVNIEGGHRGIELLAAPLYADADADRRSAQATLDNERATLQAEIASSQARVDQVAATNPGATYPGRMEQWRANFETVTAADRRAIDANLARLEALPITVAARAPYPQWGPYALTAAFAFFSLFGLTMFGVKVPGADDGRRRLPAAAPLEPAPAGSSRLAIAAMAAGAALIPTAAAASAPQPAPTAVSAALDPALSPVVARVAAERVARARFREGATPAEVHKETGIPYSTCKRWRRQEADTPATVAA